MRRINWMTWPWPACRFGAEALFKENESEVADKTKALYEDSIDAILARAEVRCSPPAPRASSWPARWRPPRANAWSAVRGAF